MNNTDNKRTIIRVIPFIVLLFFLCIALNQMTFRYLRGMYNYDNFYKLEPDSVDVVVVGASSAYCSISPIRLYEKYGLSAQIFGSSNQSMLANYAWLKEAYSRQKYKVAALEVGSFVVSKGAVKRDIAAVAGMHYSKHYYEVAKEHGIKGISMLVPFVMYHDAWKYIRDYDYVENPNGEMNMLRGFNPIFSEWGTETNYALYDDNNRNFEFDTTYLDKIVAFCKENNIHLVLYKSVMCENGGWPYTWHKAISEYAEANDIALIDYNMDYYKSFAGIDISVDVAADGYHMNVEGAHKLTDSMGEYICEIADINLRDSNSSSSLTAETVRWYNDYMKRLKEEAKQ